MELDDWYPIHLPRDSTPVTLPYDVNLSEPSWAVYGDVLEGYLDGRIWLSAGGVRCKPTHWMPLPHPPPGLVRR